MSETNTKKAFWLEKAIAASDKQGTTVEIPLLFLKNEFQRRLKTEFGDKTLRFLKHRVANVPGKELLEYLSWRDIKSIETSETWEQCTLHRSKHPRKHASMMRFLFHAGSGEDKLRLWRGLFKLMAPEMYKVLGIEATVPPEAPRKLRYEEISPGVHCAVLTIPVNLLTKLVYELRDAKVPKQVLAKFREQIAAKL